jgi:hypothetical protein
VPDSRAEGDELPGPADPHERPLGSLALTTVGDVRLLGVLGEGGRSTVYDAEWEGRPVALKLYKSFAVARHDRKHPLTLARYEYERNAAFFAVPGLQQHVAEPLGYIATAGASALVQERLDGKLYYFHHRDGGGRIDQDLYAQMARILELAHGAGLYDVDLHAMNVMVTRPEGGRPLARIFDFNLIPFHVRPPNPFVKFLLRSGLRSPRERDLRKLRNFHDFTRVERKLLRFYPQK